MLKLPVLDVDGEKLGVVNDFGIATGEVFPHVTSLAFRGPGKTPFMISWRKWVDRIDETGVYLNTSATNIRFSYLQPTELLLARDVLNKQIVDTQGMKVVRVNDIKFSMSGENQLRLLGAEVGARGLLLGKGGQQMLLLYRVVGIFHRDALCSLQSLTGFLCHLFDVHSAYLLILQIPQNFNLSPRAESRASPFLRRAF